MSSLVVQERALYTEVWALPQYAAFSPGEGYVPLFLDMASLAPGATVLDAGCGSGKGALALAAHGCRVTLCDLTDAGLLPDAAHFPFHEAVLWRDLRPLGRFDYVYCTDVLEHVPTPFTMLVISRLLEVARRGVFLSISLMPDGFGAWVGKPLHQTVQAFPRWQEQIGALGTIRESRDLLHTGLFLVDAC